MILISTRPVVKFSKTWLCRRTRASRRSMLVLPAFPGPMWRVNVTQMQAIMPSPGAADRVTETVYDSAGRVIASINAEGGIESFIFDHFFQPKRFILPLPPARSWYAIVSSNVDLPVPVLPTTYTCENRSSGLMPNIRRSLRSLNFANVTTSNLQQHARAKRRIVG